MMHSDQIYIDADIAREMLFEQFPQYRHEQVKAFGSGTVRMRTGLRQSMFQSW
jgi:hypothetical protein